MRAGLKGACSGANATLEAAIEREPQSPVAGAYQLWIADNLRHDGDPGASLALYDAAIAAFQVNEPLIRSIDWIGGALLKKAQAAALAGDLAIAVETWQALAKHDPSNANALFQAGLLMEKAGDRDRAAQFYKAIASKIVSRKADDPAELARRGLERLSAPDEAFLPTAEQVVDALQAAFTSREARRLQSLASSTHFAIGPVGGHPAFEPAAFLEQLWRDFAESEVRINPPLSGDGNKRYLQTTGWRGQWFRGDVVFLLSRSARGWQWTGCGISTLNDHWLEHWRPRKTHSNDPLPFELLAPWPEGVCFTAGGLGPYLRDQIILAYLAATAWPFGAIAAAAAMLALSARDCGFGPRGFYYNDGDTHDEGDFFAIDFTRYQRFVPYLNRSGGTPVLAPRFGTVGFVNDAEQNGSDTDSNTVEIHHGDPNDPGNDDRYTSRYLHLEGPLRIPVSMGMAVFTGNRIGLMDDTGMSVMSHLHFSIHDRRILVPGYPMGGSVRPTPMNGTALGDDDSGKCVCSTNLETVREPPMIFPTGFAVQNFVIVPVATAVAQAPPANIRQQRFHLILSGIVLIDMKGVSPDQWRRETLSIQSQPEGCRHGRCSTLRAAAAARLPDAWFAAFQVEQLAPFYDLEFGIQCPALDQLGLRGRCLATQPLLHCERPRDGRPRPRTFLPASRPTSPCATATPSYIALVPHYARRPDHLQPGRHPLRSAADRRGALVHGDEGPTERSEAYRRPTERSQAHRRPTPRSGAFNG